MFTCIVGDVSFHLNWFHSAFSLVVAFFVDWFNDIGQCLRIWVTLYGTRSLCKVFSCCYLSIKPKRTFAEYEYVESVELGLHYLFKSTILYSKWFLWVVEKKMAQTKFKVEVSHRNKVHEHNTVNLHSENQAKCFHVDNFSCIPTPLSSWE